MPVTYFAKFVEESGRMWPVLKGQSKEMVFHSEGNWKPQKVFRLESDMRRVALYGDDSGRGG